MPWPDYVRQNKVYFRPVTEPIEKLIFEKFAQSITDDRHESKVDTYQGRIKIVNKYYL